MLSFDYYIFISYILNVSPNKDNQSKIWWTNDLKKLKSSMLVIKYKIFQTEEDKIKYKRLRKDFKNIK
jgi:hypothetical protein